MRTPPDAEAGAVDAGPPFPGDPAVAVQRRVGFEFEDGNWHPWRRTRRTNQVDQITPAERKAVLHTGTNFRVEADDTPGPDLSNMEFVTEPFDETDAGVAALQTTMNEITRIMDRLDTLVGRPGPAAEGGGPPYDLEAGDKERYVRHGRYITHGRHKFNGSPGLEAKDVYLSGGVRGGQLKMQSTSGIPLADLPAVMERLGRQVPGETAAQTEQRRPERALVYPEADENEPLKVQGNAPTLARQVITSLQTDPAFTDALQDDTGALTGFLATVLMCVKLLQRPAGRGRPVKYRLTLMPRNSFAQMFQALPQPQQDAIRADPVTFGTHLLQVSNTHPLMAHKRDEGLLWTSPLIRPNPGPVERTDTGVAPGPPAALEVALATVSIQDWITGIANGQDYLTPTDMQKWLVGQAGIAQQDQNEAVDLLESFGTATALDQRDTGTQLPLFENRTIAPLGPGVNLNIAQATQYAMNMLLFFQRVREGR